MPGPDPKVQIPKDPGPETNPDLGLGISYFHRQKNECKKYFGNFPTL